MLKAGAGCKKKNSPPTVDMKRYPEGFCLEVLDDKSHRLGRGRHRFRERDIVTTLGRRHAKDLTRCPRSFASKSFTGPAGRGASSPEQKDLKTGQKYEHISLYVYVYMFIYICIYVYIYVYTGIYVCTHT